MKSWYCVSGLPRPWLRQKHYPGNWGEYCALEAQSGGNATLNIYTLTLLEEPDDGRHVLLSMLKT
jgi:hypothetical protein